MKKLLFTLIALLTAGSAMAGHWVTFTYDEFDETLPYGYTLTKDDVTIEVESGMITANEFRIYADSHVAIKHVVNEDAEAGIMTVEFTCTAQDNNRYGPGKLYADNEFSRGLYSYSGYVGTWQDGFLNATDNEFTPITEEEYDVYGSYGEVSFYANAQVRCTEIKVYVRGDYENPVTPTVQTGAPTFNGYTTDGIHAYFVEIIETEPSTIYYRVQYPDGSWTEWAEYEEVLSFVGDGKYRVEAYAVADGKLPSEQIAYEFVVAPLTGLSELANGKTVAGVRYFNAMGQEMQEANGMTIVVTTYTDGTTSTAKVIK